MGIASHELGDIVLKTQKFLKKIISSGAISHFRNYTFQSEAQQPQKHIYHQFQSQPLNHQHNKQLQHSDH